MNIMNFEYLIDMNIMNYQYLIILAVLIFIVIIVLKANKKDFYIIHMQHEEYSLIAKDFRPQWAAGSFHKQEAPALSHFPEGQHTPTFSMH